MADNNMPKYNDNNSNRKTRKNQNDHICKLLTCAQIKARETKNIGLGVFYVIQPGNR